MSGHDSLANRTRTRGVVGQRLALWPALWLAAAAVLASGCKEHRISLTEFMAIQEETETAEGMPSTQPAEPITLDSTEQATIDRELGPYRVAIGDVLGISVLESGTRSVGEPGAGLGGTPARVDRKGQIRLPQVGTIQVAGLELEDVEAKVLDELVKRKLYTDPEQISVSATVAAPRTTDVLVKGAATTPGVVRLRQSERNLLYALSAAGGATQIASGEVTIKRLRQPGQEATFDLYDPEQLRAALAQPPLESGDIIEVVAANPNTVFVGGLVNVPGPQPYPPGSRVTLLQALAAANGVRSDLLSVHEATLIRRVNGKDVHVKLDLNRLQSSKDPNIMLAAGDVLWVPHTVETRVEEWINKNIFFRAGASATANYGLDYSMPGVDYLNNAAMRQAFQGRTSTLQDTFDPFGFILRNQSLQSLQGR